MRFPTRFFLATATRMFFRIGRSGALSWTRHANGDGQMSEQRARSNSTDRRLQNFLRQIPQTQLRVVADRAESIRYAASAQRAATNRFFLTHPSPAAAASETRASEISIRHAIGLIVGSRIQRPQILLGIQW